MDRSSRIQDGSKFVSRCPLQMCHVGYGSSDTNPNKSANMVARMPVGRVFTIFAIPEKLHFDQGKEFENRVVCSVAVDPERYGRCTTPLRPHKVALFQTAYTQNDMPC